MLNDNGYSYHLTIIAFKRIPCCQKNTGNLSKDRANHRQKNIIIDPLRTITFGTAASFYRLISKIVINVQNEQELQLIFEDPYDIMIHLVIDSEETLGFISGVVYRTVVEHSQKASALIF